MIREPAPPFSVRSGRRHSLTQFSDGYALERSDDWVVVRHRTDPPLLVDREPRLRTGHEEVPWQRRARLNCEGIELTDMVYTSEPLAKGRTDDRTGAGPTGRAWLVATANIAGSVVLGVVAVFLGLAVGRLV